MGGGRVYVSNEVRVMVRDSGYPWMMMMMDGVTALTMRYD